MSATLKLTHKTIGAEVRRGTYDVVVDGKPAGSVELNETIDIPVEPGHHTLQVRNGRNSQGARRLQPLVRGARGGTPEYFRGGADDHVPASASPWRAGDRAGGAEGE